MDFFLWGYLKDKVYGNKPRTIDALKLEIERQCRDIPNDMFRDVCESLGRDIGIWTIMVISLNICKHDSSITFVSCIRCYFISLYVHFKSEYIFLRHPVWMNITCYSLFSNYSKSRKSLKQSHSRILN